MIDELSDLRAWKPVFDLAIDKSRAGVLCDEAGSKAESMLSTASTMLLGLVSKPYGVRSRHRTNDCCSRQLFHEGRRKSPSSPPQDTSLPLLLAALVNPGNGRKPPAFRRVQPKPPQMLFSYKTIRFSISKLGPTWPREFQHLQRRFSSIPF
jgi:hypothetical protein